MRIRGTSNLGTGDIDQASSFACVEIAGAMGIGRPLRQSVRVLLQYH
jgi:hypothetical protein